jgi:hypothetical protein
MHLQAASGAHGPRRQREISLVRADTHTHAHCCGGCSRSGHAACARDRTRKGACRETGGMADGMNEHRSTTLSDAGMRTIKRTTSSRRNDATRCARALRSATLTLARSDREREVERTPARTTGHRECGHNRTAPAEVRAADDGPPRPAEAAGQGNRRTYLHPLLIRAVTSAQTVQTASQPRTTTTARSPMRSPPRSASCGVHSAPRATRVRADAKVFGKDIARLRAERDRCAADAECARAACAD